MQESTGQPQKNWDVGAASNKEPTSAFIKTLKLTQVMAKLLKFGSVPLSLSTTWFQAIIFGMATPALKDEHFQSHSSQREALPPTFPCHIKSSRVKFCSLDNPPALQYFVSDGWIFPPAPFLWGFSEILTLICSVGSDPSFRISYPPRSSALQRCLPKGLDCIPINPGIQLCCDINLLVHFQHQLLSISTDIILPSKHRENSAALGFPHPSLCSGGTGMWL